MIDSVKVSNSRRWLAIVAVLAVLAGCATPRPAPVRDSMPPPAAEPGAAPAASAEPVRKEGTYTVRAGDTLLGIARQFGVSVKELVAWNGLVDRNQIHVGQVLRVSQAVDAGTVVQPVVTQPVDVQPVKPSGDTVPPLGNGVRQEPKGGKQPYSDEAWAALNPRPAAPAPAAPTAPEPDKGAVRGEWLWPAAGQVIRTFDDSTSKGVDIAGKPGDPVIASAGGNVWYAGSGLRGYGKLVIIKHDANYLTAYAHNQQLLVKEGDTVSKGQKIAELGSTDADRPKLHFEIRRLGKPVDPLKYLPAR